MSSKSKLRDNRARAAETEEGVLLLLQVPRANNKKESAAEQMFANLHSLLLLPAKSGGFFKPVVRRERLSFEIAVINKRIGFFVWVPHELKEFVEEQIYAQYPSVQISTVSDYTMNHDVRFDTTLVTEMKLTADDALPIKTFKNFEADPMAVLATTLGKLDAYEEAWIQLVIKPAERQWHHKSEQYLERLRGNANAEPNLLMQLWQPDAKPKARKLAKHEQLRVTGAEEKSQKLIFETQLRIVYRGNIDKQTAKLRVQSIVAGYKQFNTQYLNGFVNKRVVDDPFLVAHYRSREFNHHGGGMSVEELATLFHLPHVAAETPHVLWAASQTVEPPTNLPVITAEPREDVSPVANTTFQGRNTMFGLPRGDRSRHLYIVGQTGVGKSGLLELLTISDIFSSYGFAVIDPHGDYATNILKRIPPERADDVIYFNPADTDFPMGFNPLEVVNPKLKTHTCLELIGVLRRMFESWSPQLEYILRYTILALLDFPQATMLDIMPMLTNKKFRQKVLEHVQDPIVRNFWTVEFAAWNDAFAAEAVAPVLNKIGVFTANPLVRNIIGQPKSSFNIRQIMDERKILIINLNRGLVGEDNAALLGALLVTKVQLAAMSRADISADLREPFYLYVDEFQNIATDSFATILSEARKYGLSLTVANQYIGQMPMEVRDAVFGNVGSIVAFRTSAEDARTMLKYFEPRFSEHDIVHMHNRHFVANITIDGEKSPAFSGVTLNLPSIKDDQSASIIDHARTQYASSREFVERYVSEHYMKMSEPEHKAADDVWQLSGIPRTPTGHRLSSGDKLPSPAAIDLGIAALEEVTPSRHPSTPPKVTATPPKRRPRRRRLNVAVKGPEPKPKSLPSDGLQEFNASSIVHIR